MLTQRCIDTPKQDSKKLRKNMAQFVSCDRWTAVKVKCLHLNLYPSFNASTHK